MGQGPHNARAEVVSSCEASILERGIDDVIPAYYSEVPISLSLKLNMILSTKGAQRVLAKILEELSVLLSVR